MKESFESEIEQLRASQKKHEEDVTNEEGQRKKRKDKDDEFDKAYSEHAVDMSKTIELEGVERILEERKKKLLEGVSPSQREKLQEVRARHKDEVEMADLGIENQGKELEQLEGLISDAEKRNAPISSELSDAVASRKLEIEKLRKKIGELKSQETQIDSGFEPIIRAEEISREISDVENEIGQILSTPEVRNLRWEIALRENDIKDDYIESIVSNLERYDISSSSYKRSPEGAELIASLAGDLFEAEIKRLGIDKVKDEREKLKRMADLSRLINTGINDSKKLMPERNERGYYIDEGQVWTWGSGDKGLSPQDRELRFKGALFSMAAGSACLRPYHIPTVFETWVDNNRFNYGRKNSFADEPDFKHEDGKRILIDMLPIVNRFKAVAEVDAEQPYNKKVANRCEPSTNAFFVDAKGFLERDYHFGSEQFEKLGFLVDRNSIIYPKEWNETNDGRDMIKAWREKYERDRKAAIVKCNETRLKREEQRIERLRIIPDLIKDSEARLNELKRIQTDKKFIERDYMEALTEKGKLEGELNLLPEKIITSKARISAHRNAAKGMGMLEFGRKKAVKKDIEETTKSYESLLRRQRRLPAEIEIIEEKIKKLQSEHELINPPYKGESLRDTIYRVEREIENLSDERKELAQISYATSIEQ